MVQHQMIQYFLLCIVYPVIFSLLCPRPASLNGMCEDKLVTGTEVVRSEGVVCLNDIDTVSTGDDCWFICHIVDEDRVPDIRINISHIQREGSTP